MERSVFCIQEHSLAYVPEKGSKVLDVGCRYYDFSIHLANLGCKITAIEPDTDTIEPTHNNINTIRCALVPESKNGEEQTLIKFGNGTANHLQIIKGGNPKNALFQRIVGKSITQISKETDTVVWDVIKLDCEGAEYGVLVEWPGPVAKQITVEFHEHTGANTYGEEIYDKIFSHLLQWYKVIQHEKSIRHCISKPNYWDSLLVLKE